MTGLETPNYTQVPNALLDNMAAMTDTELRCTLALVRKVIGYHKDTPEPASYTQLMKLTGLSRQGVADGIKAAIERGTVRIAAKGKRGANLYTLNFADQSTQLTSQGATSQDSRLELVNSVDTQKKVSKEKEHTPDGDAPPKPVPVVAPSVADEAGADPTPDSGPHPNTRDMVRDEVIEACRFAETARNEKETYGRAGQITRYLMGLPVKRGKTWYQLAREDWRAQPGDFTRFAQWWRGKFPNADVPRSLDILAERWAEWRQAEAQRLRLASVGPRTAALNAERALYGEDVA